MAEKDDKKQEDEIKMVGPGAEALGETVESREEDDDQENREAETEDDSGDERVGRGEDDTGDREQIRARRREERKRHKEQRNRDRVELNFLRERNEVLERRFSQIEGRQTQNEMMNVDSRISTLQGQIREAEDVYSQAVSAKNGEAAAEAMRIRDQMRDDLRVLQAAKAHTAQRGRQAQTNQPDPQVVRRAQAWMRENSDWFDPSLRDEDSAVAKAVEDSLWRENRFDGRTDAYWDEYDKRLRKRLPHLFEDKPSRQRDDDDEDDETSNRKSARGGPRLTTGGRERPLGKNEVYVSPDRIEAMKEAGVWDDPVLRQRYLKRYQSYDRDHRGNR